MAIHRPRCVKCPNMPVCVCACYLRQLLTQLRAGGPWHQCGWREARYWRRVQRVLNPGLLEGSLTFSHSSLSLSLLLFFLLSPSVCKASCETVLTFDKLYEMYVVSNRSSPACQICRFKNMWLKSLVGSVSLRSNAGLKKSADKSHYGMWCGFN